jgi:hypothetical protein
VTLLGTGGNVGGVDASGTTIRSKAKITMKGEGLTLDGATLDNYADGDGYGAVTLLGTGGNVGGVDASGTTIRSKAKITMKGEGLTVTDATLDNYADGDGYGVVELLGTGGSGGDVSLVDSTVDSGGSASAKAPSTGTVDVARARFEHDADPLTVSQGDAINEDQVAAGSVDDGD